MTTIPKKKLTPIEAEKRLPPDLRPMLTELKADYENANAIHTNFKGGPNLGILSELILMGWRKAN